MIFLCTIRKSVNVLPQELVMIMIVPNLLYYIICTHNHRWNMLTGSWPQQNVFSVCRIPDFPYYLVILDCMGLCELWLSLCALPTWIFSHYCVAAPFGKVPATSPHLTPITAPIMLFLQLRSSSEDWCKYWLPRNMRWWLGPVILVLALALTGQKAVSKDQMSQGTVRSREPRFSLFHHGLLWFGGRTSWTRNALPVRDVQMW